MPNEPDPMNIWQQQPTEKTAVALEQIHRKAVQMEAKSRRESIVSLSFLVGLIALSIWKLATGQRVEQVAFGVVGLWSLAGLIISLRKHDVPVSSSGVEYYRGILKQRANQIRRGWFGLFGPILLASISFALPAIQAILRKPELAKNAIPFFALLAIWAAIYVAKVLRELRKIHRELEELKHPIA